MTRWVGRTRAEYRRLVDGATQVEWSTSTAYVHDQTSGRFATGDHAARRWADPDVHRRVRPHRAGRRGRHPRQRAGVGDPAETQSTTYGYDVAGNLTSVTDPVGNTISYDVNLAGWRTAMDDPDAGARVYGYDAAGNQTSATDAAGDTVVTVYDALDRPIERRQTSTTGPMLASWGYDQPGGLGMLDWSKRHTAEGEWTTDVTGYDTGPADPPDPVGAGRGAGPVRHLPHNLWV